MEAAEGVASCGKAGLASGPKANAAQTRVTGRSMIIPLFSLRWTKVCTDLPFRPMRSSKPGNVGTPNLRGASEVSRSLTSRPRRRLAPGTSLSAGNRVCGPPERPPSRVGSRRGACGLRAARHDPDGAAYTGTAERLGSVARRAAQAIWPSSGNGWRARVSRSKRWPAPVPLSASTPRRHRCAAPSPPKFTSHQRRRNDRKAFHSGDGRGP